MRCSLSVSINLQMAGRQQMEYGESIPVIDGFFQITSHRNTGAAWGIWPGRCGFYIITTVVIIGIVYYIQNMQRTNPARNRSRFDAWRCCRQFHRPRVQTRSCRFIHVTIVNYHYPISTLPIHLYASESCSYLYKCC
ncbi:signal peptidase II [Bacillus licheniformis]|nr:signal peptidase II [Bacillus licheniformis]